MSPSSIGPTHGIHSVLLTCLQRSDRERERRRARSIQKLKRPPGGPAFGSAVNGLEQILDDVVD